MHTVLIVQRLGVGQHQAQEDPLHRAQALADTDAQPSLHQVAATRIAVVHLGRVAVHVARELVEKDDQRHQKARVIDVERPVVVVTFRRQRHVGAEAGPDILVGLLGLAEPQVEAILDVRTQHVLQHLLGLVDFGGRDLDAFELEQHAQFASQRVGVRFRQGVALLDSREDHLQALLDAAAQHLRGFLRGGQVHQHGQQIGHHSSP